MLEKMYEKGYLNYTKLILNEYKKLEITERDAIVLIKILDLYMVTKKIRAVKISQETLIPKKDVEESLNNLIIKHLYGIDVVVGDTGLQDERVSISPLFDKLENLYKDALVIEAENSLSELITMYEKEVQKNISPQEYQIIEGFITNDGYQIDEVKDAIIECVKQGRITLSNVEKRLITNRKNILNPKNDIDPSKAKALDEVMKLFNDKNKTNY